MTAASPAGKNPYVGLRPFDREDSLYYFGRRQQTSELLERLHENRFLAVVGSSGCGKSSLVRAGLIPALDGGFLVEKRDRWLVAIMKPGDSPRFNLASALCAVAGRPATDAAILEKEIDEDLADAVAEFLRPVLGADTNLLILVDQFEEVFAFRGSEDDEQFESLSPEMRRDRGRHRAEASNFVDLLLALGPAALPIYVVLTMRSDFLGDCELFYGLPEAMNRSRYLVPRLTRQELRDAVQGPALLSGVKVAPRLLDTVLNDLGGRMEQLPVLQHALYRTWNEWEKTRQGPIDLPHYTAIGGLRGALSQHATEALREEDRAQTALIFKRLTDTDPNQRRIRRPAHVKELAGLCDGNAEIVNRIIQRFQSEGRNFLVRSNARDGDDRIDISHESLIRQWPQLREWIDAERASRDQFLDLVKGARQQKALLQNPDLQLALKWKNDNRPTTEWAARYSRDGSDFKDAMDYLARSEEAAAAAVRKRKQLQRAVTAASIAIIVTLAVFLWISKQAEARARLAEARAKRAEETAMANESEAKKPREQFASFSSVVSTRLKSGEDRATKAEQLVAQLKSQLGTEGARFPAPPPPPPPKGGDMKTDSAIAEALRPESPVTLMATDLSRSIAYSNVSLNFKGNAITVAPSETFTITFRWQGVVPKEPYCPGCIVQFYYGIASKAASNNSKCFVSDIIPAGWSRMGDVKGTLTAPQDQGTYYITQGATLEYYCQEQKVKQPAGKADALAVIQVR